MKRFSPLLLSLSLVFLLSACGAESSDPNLSQNGQDSLVQEIQPALTANVGHKLVVYQMMTRLFGNQKTTNSFNGTLAENGSGKFSDISSKALQELKGLGATHIWYTGVLEHATMNDFSAEEIPLDDADVVKGRAGSPYSIKDYYDVNPYLANDPEKRKEEFKALIDRTHAEGLAVVIDFVPNHVARDYFSDTRPKGVKDLGEQDDPSKGFDRDHNFYYIAGENFKVPSEYDPLGTEEKGPKEDGKFDEKPAKATGNNVFKAEPSVNDWFETAKLNYGIDFQDGEKKYFEGEPPSTWVQMKDILVYWAEQGVDGFRCDMAEMVPVEFWGWAIPQVKAARPGLIFIAEIYNPAEYHNYVQKGKFDYLYDKVGTYDRVRELMSGKGSIAGLTEALQQSEGIEAQMLRFLENHDEQRIAAKEFAGDMRAGVPGMTVSATLGQGPVMLYFGQEVGEPGLGAEGFQGEDGRTTIFDYWGVPEHQKWMNGGAFDGAGLNQDQQELRGFYQKLLNLSKSSNPIREGELHLVETGNPKAFAFFRVTETEQVLVLANFDGENEAEVKIKFPGDIIKSAARNSSDEYNLRDLLNNGEKFKSGEGELNFTAAPWGAYIFKIYGKS